MGHIVKRVDNAALNPAGNMDVRPPIERKGEALDIRSQVFLGAQPYLLISWKVSQSFWSKGFTLLGFRNTSGFAKTRRPKDLSEHGQLILEETADGCREESLPEGTYYYTFFLRKHHWFAPSMSEPVRFSETIPSAKTAIGRYRDGIELLELQEELELRPSLSEIKRNEMQIKLLRSRETLARIPRPGDPLEVTVRRELEEVIRGAMKNAYTHVELASEREALLKNVRKHAGFRSLKPEQQEDLLNEIRDALDPSEIRMRRRSEGY
jgi:hypothetical protein